MADLRFDPVTGVWVAIARNRDARPMEYVAIDTVQHQLICPFCSGNEDETPDPVLVFGPQGKQLTDPNEQTNWLSRIVPNKFPSLAGRIPDRLRGNDDKEIGHKYGPFSSLETDGIQEILIPSPRHIFSFSELSDEELLTAMVVLQFRLAALAEDKSTEHVMLFMNCRLEAGASLGHIHLQIMSSPKTSVALQHRRLRDLKHREENNEPLIQTVATWEKQQEKRVLQVTDHFTVLCPFASRFAFQVWIIPHDLQRNFAKLTPAESAELGLLLRTYVSRIESELKDPAYNILLHQEPHKRAPANDSFCPWYVELFPRVSRAAGYELGTDVWVNPMSPELAANRLRR